MAAASEQDKLTREVRDSGRALEEAQMAARGHGRELGRMDDALDDVQLAAKESARELTRTETAFNARPFVTEMGKVDREARTTARRAEDAFDDAGEQGGRKMGEGIRRGLTGIRDSFIGNFAAGVAQETGFSDQSHFSNAFKRMIGLTPGQFRRVFGGETEEDEGETNKA